MKKIKRKTKYKRIGQAILILSAFTTIGLQNPEPVLAAKNQSTRMTRQQLTKIIRKHHTNLKLVHAIIEVESSRNPNAISKCGAVGLMQVTPRSAKYYAGVNRLELFSPEKNIEVGCKILRFHQKNSRDLKTALTKYSGGSSRYYDKVKAAMGG